MGMAKIKPFTKINPETLQQLGIQDCQDNLFEFTLMMSQKIDFDTFDVLSVTRVDQPQQSQHFLHPKVEPQSPPISAKIIPLRKKKPGK